MLLIKERLQEKDKALKLWKDAKRETNHQTELYESVEPLKMQTRTYFKILILCL